MVTIRRLAVDDIGAAQRLREQAGWNQTDHDWRRLLAWSPHGCWVAEDAGRVVGTTAVAIYGLRVAWIGMVLVEIAHRRQGIGRALLNHAIAYLDGLGVQTIALDSTPEGQPLYASLGFADAFELSRWRGPIPARTPGPALASLDGSLATVPCEPLRAAPGARTLSAQPGQFDASGTGDAGDAVQVRCCQRADLPTLAVYDARLFGTDRSHILGALLAGHPERCFVAERGGEIIGYALSRPGARAWHLGPLAADDGMTARRLTWAALASGVPSGAASPGSKGSSAGEMVMDVVMPNRAAVVLAGVLGLAQVRRFIRMARGAPLPAADLDRLYTSAGPEVG
jgi:predicted N-acetyltransferase YhbS